MNLGLLRLGHRLNASDPRLSRKKIEPGLQISTAKYQACNESSWNYVEPSLRNWFLYIVSWPWCFLKKTLTSLIESSSEPFMNFIKIAGGGLVVFYGGFYVMKIFLHNIRAEALEIQRRRVRKTLLQLKNFDPSQTAGSEYMEPHMTEGALRESGVVSSLLSSRAERKSGLVKIIDYAKLSQKTSRSTAFRTDLGRSRLNSRLQAQTSFRGSARGSIQDDTEDEQLHLTTSEEDSRVSIQVEAEPSTEYIQTSTD